MLSFVVDCMSFAPTGMAVRAAPKLARPAVVMSASLVEVSSCTRAVALDGPQDHTHLESPTLTLGPRPEPARTTAPTSTFTTTLALTAALAALLFEKGWQWHRGYT